MHCEINCNDAWMKEENTMKVPKRKKLIKIYIVFEIKYSVTIIQFLFLVLVFRLHII
jgi:hypothetical protein